MRRNQGGLPRYSGVQIETGSLVQGVDFEDTRVMVNGTWVAFDVILGADGIKSVVRNALLDGLHEEDKGENS